MPHKLVLLINPPNSSTLSEGQSPRVGRPAEHSDWSDYPATGILTLASALLPIPGIHPIYIDGVVVPFQDIVDFISCHKRHIAIIGISALTDTYEAGLKILEHARHENPKIIHIMGNDHLTALPDLCLRNRQHLIDFGFLGNEIIGSVRDFVTCVANGGLPSQLRLPGMMCVGAGEVIRIPQRPEPLYATIDYRLLDDTFPHSRRYDTVFQRTFPQRIQRWFGRTISRGVAIELARGCVKFKNDDACSFCSIQYGGMWRNSLRSGGAAWDVIHRAHRAGYDYLYVTADELALTFNRLLTDMRDNVPPWYRDLSPDERPVLTGYARTDGIASERNARLLYDLGFRVIMVGVDAGPKISLQAVNKPFAGGDAAARLEHLYEANRRAFAQAKKVGLRLRIGFVLGHIGMTADVLRQNAAYFYELVDSNPDAVCTADIEILSPEPGSKEYLYLLAPTLASERARELGLRIAESSTRRAIAAKWAGRDVIAKEELIGDYIAAFMPESCLADLIQIRNQMREFCRSKGVLIGEG